MAILNPQGFLPCLTALERAWDGPIPTRHLTAVLDESRGLAGAHQKLAAAARDGVSRRRLQLSWTAAPADLWLVRLGDSLSFHRHHGVCALCRACP